MLEGTWQSLIKQWFRFGSTDTTSFVFGMKTIQIFKTYTGRFSLGFNGGVDVIVPCHSYVTAQCNLTAERKQRDIWSKSRSSAVHSLLSRITVQFRIPHQWHWGSAPRKNREKWKLNESNTLVNALHTRLPWIQNIWLSSISTNQHTNWLLLKGLSEVIYRATVCTIKKSKSLSF